MRLRASATTVAAACVWAIAALSVTACDGRVQQCNRLIKVINDEQEPLKKAPGSNDPAALKTIADTLDTVAKKVAEVDLEDERLVKFRDDYKTMAEDLAKASRDTAGAFESNDPKKAAEATKHMASFGPRETELVGAINKYCQGG